MSACAVEAVPAGSASTYVAVTTSPGTTSRTLSPGTTGACRMAIPATQEPGPAPAASGSVSVSSEIEVVSVTLGSVTGSTLPSVTRILAMSSQEYVGRLP